MTINTTHKDDLVLDNIKWAKRMANQVCDRWNVGIITDIQGNIVAVDRDDYHQAAMVGLVESARSFKGQSSFRTYAYRKIRGGVLREVISNWNIGSFGSYKAYEFIFTNLPHVLRKLNDNFDSEAVADELNKTTDLIITTSAVEDVYSYMDRYQSLNTTIELDDGDTVELVDLIADDKPDPETLLLQEEQKAQLHQAMQNIKLDDLDQEIVVLRMLAEDPMSQADLGSRFKISQQAVAKRETIIIEKLRKEMNICK